MELTISLPTGAQRVATTGTGESNLKIIREALGVNIAARDHAVKISGDRDAVGKAAAVMERLSAAARRQAPMSRQQLLETITAIGSRIDPVIDADEQHVHPIAADNLDVYLQGRRIRAMSEGQHAYLKAIIHHDLTFCSGPAGTGKTYLAVAVAVAMLKRSLVRKLVLVRPAVEAGEKLGFLPGDMQQKVNPYLRPLLDAVHDMMDYEQVQRFMAVDVIEMIPLAFMRGRTLNDSLIILDEAQNTTKSQMLMFLTRLGHGSKMIVTGDTSQVDLPDPTDSGLIDAARRLRHVPGIAFVTLLQQDIVRHNLVQRVVEAYDQRHTK